MAARSPPAASQTAPEPRSVPSLPSSLAPSSLAEVEPPKMRVVSKGWTYRERQETQAQVQARIRE